MKTASIYKIGLLLMVWASIFAQQIDAQEASSSPNIKPLASDVQAKLIGMLRSPDRKQQIQALEYLKQVPPSGELKSQVKTMAESSPDSIIQGYARLLAADWGVENSPNAVALNLNDFNSPDIMVNNSPPGMSLRNPHPNQYAQQTSFAQQTAIANPNAIPNANAIAVGLSDGGPGNSVGLIPADSRAAMQYEGEMQMASPQGAGYASSFLAPQSPFWADSATFESSVPADVEKFNQGLMEIDRGFDPLPKASPQTSGIRPDILDRSIDAQYDAYLDPPIIKAGGFLTYERDAPHGFTGRSGVVQTEFQQSDHFVPIEDRWRIGLPEWDRYGKGHPREDDYPGQKGSIWDPYNQNVLKGDFPVIGQHIFYMMQFDSITIHEFRQTPTATTPFESTQDAFQAPFFGEPDQLFYAPYFRFAFELFHGNEAFKPIDWKVRIQPVFNVNNLEVDELAVVNPDVRQGTDRLRDDFALEEWFIEAKLSDIGPDYDFVSARVGSQLFASDFRGFIFRDVNRAVRLFGTRLANRDQFNLVWFDQAEKDTNSELNSFRDRHQNVVIANYFRQDFVVPGYTALASFHYNHDKPSFTFDDNNNLVRPDPVGVFKPHEVNSYYIGLAGTGHIGRINVLNQIYVALGNDSTNPIGGTPQEINAQMAALELSYDRDWIRFRTSYFFASGDSDPDDGKAEGFDTIVDDPIFAGGEFSYWQRQSVRLFGTNLTQRKSIVPNLRSSKAQGQSNFVNPGLHLFNFGMDFEVTPKTRIITNSNYMYFDETAVLETYTFQNKINSEIGTDLSLGIEHRPFLNDNAIIVIGLATLIPDRGLKDLFGSELPEELRAIGVGNELQDHTPQFTSGFLEVVLTY